MVKKIGEPKINRPSELEERSNVKSRQHTCMRKPKESDVLSRLQTIREKSVRRKKHVRCEKPVRKKGAYKITRKLNTHVLRFDYFLAQLNFIPYRTRKSFVSCIITASTARWFETREICLMKQHKQHEITHIRVSHCTCLLRLTDVSRIVCS